MSPTHRRMAVATAVALLALAGPSWPAAAQGGRPPGVPPAVDPGQRPPSQQPAVPDTQYALDDGCIQPNTTGATVVTKPWGQLTLRFEELWRFGRGKDIKVAVIDTGVNSHPALTGRLDRGGDYIEDKGGTFDCDGHGTLVAGIIAAQKEDKIGFAGVAPEARIIAIRQSSTKYKGKDPDTQRDRPAGTTKTLAKAVIRAVDLGAKVINISEAACFPASSNQMGHQDLQAAVHHAVDSNVVVVAAAGNLAGPDADTCKDQNEVDKIQTIAEPAWFDDALTVAATEKSGNAAGFSLHGPWVDIAAPGTEITSLDPAPEGTVLANLINGKDKKLQEIQGTSFAAPYVAGVVALVRARYPHLNARQVMNRITKTAQHPGNQTGRNNTVGYGMIDPIAAMTAILPEEQGVTPSQPQAKQINMPPAVRRNWTPVVVAVSGAGGGLALLGLTLFITHTISRARARPTRPHRVL